MEPPALKLESTPTLAPPPADVVLVFGYGSLVFSPELPEAVIGVFPARATGLRRALNKRSNSRFCPAEDSFAAFDDELGLRRKDGAYASIVLGTEVACGEMDGMVIAYPREAELKVLRRTDPREGVWPDRPSHLNGYVRERIEVTLLPSCERRASWIYLTNPDPACTWRLPPGATLEQKARAIINATPRPPAIGDAQDDYARDSRGLRYVEGTRRVLAGAGIADPELEAVARLVHAWPGPWTSLMAPPR